MLITTADAISAAIGTLGLGKPARRAKAPRAADCAASAFSKAASVISFAFSGTRSLVSATFCLTSSLTSAFPDKASTVSPSSLGVCSLPVWVSSIPASGPGWGDGGFLSVVTVGVLHFVDVLFDVGNGHLRWWVRLRLRVHLPLLPLTQ